MEEETITPTKGKQMEYGKIAGAFQVISGLCMLGFLAMFARMCL